MKNALSPILRAIVRTEHMGPKLVRLAIGIVFLWIGALKFVPYEADSITPFVANSPLMSYFYNQPDGYKQHMTHEGELNVQKREWQVSNNTYGYSKGLGTVELFIAVLVLAYPVNRWAGLAGGVLSFLTPLVTLSFLITTPEAWVPALGDAQHGFPYLSGAGRLVLKDTMMLAGAWVITVDAAKSILRASERAAVNGWSA